MKRILLAGVIAGASAGYALAADLGPYRPPPPEPLYEPARDMPYSWRGFYIGVNAGYGWGDSNIEVNGPVGTGSTGSVDLDGWFGGGQVGYNAQFHRLVLGVEADIQASDFGESASFDGDYAGQASTNIDWFSTVRGRIGYDAGPTLLYVTGGFAFADVDYSATGTGFALSSDKIETGYTLGGGVEWAFAPNWSLKTEYLYVDLGDEGVTSGGLSADNDLDFHTVRAGLNFKF